MANVRGGAALVAAVVTGLMLVLAGTSAAAPDAPGTCDIGTAKGVGAATVDGRPVSFDFTVCETGPLATDTTGRYAPKAGGPGTQGPVRCADLNERTMAFLYAVDRGAADGGKQVLVVVSDGGPEPRDDRIGFTEPRSPQDFPDGCGLGSPPAQEVTQEWQPLTEGNITVTLNG